ncbi:MAG TPA: DegT/DnrJ/EryC1/StrS family aminotransferase [Chloroflexota bacterium]|nr:DegT/DnrJ/EryC1/StrS family aminotransferase [Chloroflexota bacterium]
MKIPLCDLKAQYATIQKEIDDAIQSVISNTSFIQGKECRLLEQQFAAFSGAQYGIATSSGTDSLHLALLALGVGPDHEVITTPLTFTATAEAISHCGGTPVFVDIDPKTYNMDPARLESKITKRTKVILPVHLYGQPVDMDAVLAVADRHGIAVLEDAAQAHGAEYKGKRIGSIGSAACFSFYPGKNLGAYGDAGMITTNDKKLADWCSMMGDHGRTEKYSHDYIGYGKRMDTIQAAVLLAKLRHLDEWTAARRERAAIYDRMLAGVVETPYQPEWAKSVYHQYVIRVPNRDDVFNRMKEAAVGVGIHYPIPLHLQPAFRSLGHRKGDFPNAEKAADSVLSLPIFPEMTLEQQSYVVDQLKAALKR